MESISVNSGLKDVFLWIDNNSKSYLTNKIKILKKIGLNN